MSWFRSKTTQEPAPQESYMERIERLYPLGSKWLYLGLTCMVLQHRDYDGFPDFRVQYVDHGGVVRECSATPDGLQPHGGEGA